MRFIQCHFIHFRTNTSTNKYPCYSAQTRRRKEEKKEELNLPTHFRNECTQIENPRNNLKISHIQAHISILKIISPYVSPNHLTCEHFSGGDSYSHFFWCACFDYDQQKAFTVAPKCAETFCRRQYQ